MDHGVSSQTTHRDTNHAPHCARAHSSSDLQGVTKRTCHPVKKLFYLQIKKKFTEKSSHLYLSIVFFTRTTCSVIMLRNQPAFEYLEKRNLFISLRANRFIIFKKKKKHLIQYLKTYFLMIIVYAIIREFYLSQKDTIPSTKDIKLSNDGARYPTALYLQYQDYSSMQIHLTTRERKPVKSPIVINAEIATSSYSESYGSSAINVKSTNKRTCNNDHHDSPSKLYDKQFPPVRRHGTVKY